MKTRLFIIAPLFVSIAARTAASPVSPDWAATSASVALAGATGTGVTASGTNIHSGIHTKLFADGSGAAPEIGQTLTLEATVNFGGTLASASEQSGAFRFGLYHTNASAGTTGWSGYFALADTTGSSGTAGGLYERNGSAQDYWSGSGGSRLSTYVSSETAFAAGTDYRLRISLTRLDAGIRIDALMARAADFSQTLISESRTDTASPVVTFDRFGLFASDRLGADSLVISDVTLTVVPECGSTWIVPALAGVLGFRMRRKIRL